ncbi:MAG: hypothetical protein QOG91_404 [Candidatus Parcubacteria bacterium]|nr:hypothetical protein [Candidatus Parcubacteria bacterium]
MGSFERGEAAIQLELGRVADASMFLYSGLQSGAGYELQYSADLAVWKHAKVLYGNGADRVNIYSGSPAAFYRIKSGIPADLGIVTVGIDPSSPLSSIRQISTVGETDNVVLAVFDVKSENVPSTLRHLSFEVSSSGAAVTSLFNDIKIKAGSLIYSADNVGTNTVFSDLAIPLPADQYVPVTVFGKIPRDSNGSLDGVSVRIGLSAGGSGGGIRNNPEVENWNYDLLEVNENTLEGNQQAFSSSGLVMSNAAASLGTPIMLPNGEVIAYEGITFGFDITAGADSVYISSDPTISLAFFVPPGTTATFPKDGFVADPQALTSDGPGYYVIPAGSSRRFVCHGSLINTSGDRGIKQLWVGFIVYGVSNDSLELFTLTYGLQALRVVAVF